MNNDPNLITTCWFHKDSFPGRRHSCQVAAFRNWPAIPPQRSKLMVSAYASVLQHLMAAKDAPLSPEDSCCKGTEQAGDYRNSTLHCGYAEGQSITRAACLPFLQQKIYRFCVYSFCCNTTPSIPHPLAGNAKTSQAEMNPPGMANRRSTD